MKVRSTIILILAVLFLAGASQAGGDQAKLQKRIQKLEQRVEELETLLKPMKEELQAKARKDELREKFEKRYQKDQKTYSSEELREITSLYQVANRNWGTPETIESLKKLVAKYDKSNRTGCALLYLGQMTEGEEREKYLTQAATQFGDCMYGDGVQVGAYARYYLAYDYKEKGQLDKARKMIQEIEKQYPGAIDHSGRLLSQQLAGFLENQE